MDFGPYQHFFFNHLSGKMIFPYVLLSTHISMLYFKGGLWYHM